MGCDVITASSRSDLFLVWDVDWWKGRVNTLARLHALLKASYIYMQCETKELSSVHTSVLWSCDQGGWRVSYHQTKECFCSPTKISLCSQLAVLHLSVGFRQRDSQADSRSVIQGGSLDYQMIFNLRSSVMTSVQFSGSFSSSLVWLQLDFILKCFLPACTMPSLLFSAFVPFFLTILLLFLFVLIPRSGGKSGSNKKADGVKVNILLFLNIINVIISEYYIYM